MFQDLVIKKQGYLVIEILLTVVMFMVIATAGIIAVVSGLDNNRVAGELLVATQYISEGVEAVRSIRNQAFANLGETVATGVTRNGTSGTWQFSGGNNIFESRYTREINIAPVNRDVIGNIVTAPAGTADGDSWKVTSTVRWAFTAAKPRDQSISTYLTNWRAPITPKGGLVVYSDSTTRPKWRSFDGVTGLFGAESASIPVGTVPRTIEIRVAPNKREAVAGYVNSSGVLRVICYDGATWTNEWSLSVGGNGTTKRFSVAYERGSGDVVVLYSRNLNNSNNGVAYRVKPGATGCGAANWAAAVNFPTTPAATRRNVAWVNLSSNPVFGSNEIAAAWSDTSSDLGGAIYDGSSWNSLSSLETNLEYVSSPSDSPSYDVGWEAVSGQAMVVWGVRTAGSACSAGNCLKSSQFEGAWTPPAFIPTVDNSSTNIDLSANPNTDELILGAIDNGTAAGNAHRLSAAYWSGSSWTGFAGLDTNTATPIAGTKMVATGWLVNGATERAIVLYDKAGATNVSWFSCTPTGCVAQTTLPTLTTTSSQRWYEVRTNPDPLNQNQLIVALSDSANDFYAKQLTMSETPTFSWVSSDGGTALERSLAQAITSPFSLAYWK